MVLVQTTLDGARADISKVAEDLDTVDLKARRAIGTLNRMVGLMSIMQLPPALKAQWGIIDKTTDKLMQLYMTYQLVQLSTPWGAIAGAFTLTSVAMGGLQDVADYAAGNMR